MYEQKKGNHVFLKVAGRRPIDIWEQKKNTTNSMYTYSHKFFSSVHISVAVIQNKTLKNKQRESL